MLEQIREQVKALLDEKARLDARASRPNEPLARHRFDRGGTRLGHPRPGRPPGTAQGAGGHRGPGRRARGERLALRRHPDPAREASLLAGQRPQRADRLLPRGRALLLRGRLRRPQGPGLGSGRRAAAAPRERGPGRGPRPEFRDVGTSAFSALVVPQFLVDLYAENLFAGRVTANLAANHQLPPEGLTLTLPRGTTAARVEARDVGRTSRSRRPTTARRISS